VWLLLCSSTDAPALWAYQGLRRFGVAPLELVFAEGLARADRWDHRLDAHGVHLTVTLADGRVIDASRVRGVMNRLITPSPMCTFWTAAQDSEYVQSELHAFYLSWLKSLPGIVINKPTGTGLCGSWMHPSEWTFRAARAGLKTRCYRQEARREPERFATHAKTGRLIAFQGEVFGSPPPEGIKTACTKLAEDAGAEMLGIDFQVDASGQWIFSDATPCPDLSLGGMPLLSRLANVLQDARP
jgi:hypothetical protein